MVDVQKMNVQVEILGYKGARLKKIQYRDEVQYVDRWAVYRWAMYRCSDL